MLIKKFYFFVFIKVLIKSVKSKIWRLCYAAMFSITKNAPALDLAVAAVLLLKTTNYPAFPLLSSAYSGQLLCP